MTQPGPQRRVCWGAGVSWVEHDQRWQAEIDADAGDGEIESQDLGRFEDEVEAALAYDLAASEYHGDQAELNFPDPLVEPQMSSGKTPRKSTSQYRGKRSGIRIALWRCYAWLAMSISNPHVL
jgi:hypothetical protein